MRHRSATRHFNRDTKAREALILSLVSNLLQTGRIVTTRPMAKEAQRQMEKLISKAKVEGMATRRELHKFFGKRSLVNVMVEQVAPAMAGRTSGFTKVTAYGQRRGDNAELFVLEFVEEVNLMAEEKKVKRYAVKTKVKKEKSKAEVKKSEKKAAVKEKARAGRTDQKKDGQNDRAEKAEKAK